MVLSVSLLSAWGLRRMRRCCLARSVLFGHEHCAKGTHHFCLPRLSGYHFLSYYYSNATSNRGRSANHPVPPPVAPNRPPVTDLPPVLFFLFFPCTLGYFRPNHNSCAVFLCGCISVSQDEDLKCQPKIKAWKPVRECHVSPGCPESCWSPWCVDGVLGTLCLCSASQQAAAADPPA